MRLCGIDEAGRGPVIGPMVMVGLCIEENQLRNLKKLGVKDSKLLTKRERENIYDEIIKLHNHHLTFMLHPPEIDARFQKGKNLNGLEAAYTVTILRELEPDKVFIDCPSRNISGYKDFLMQELNKQIELLVEFKADLHFPLVGAASILAKVTRDRIIERTKTVIGIDFGSGYPSDPKTKAFLEKYWNNEDYLHLFRKTWQPWLNKKKRYEQRSLAYYYRKLY